jgi:hypothetical protein
MTIYICNARKKILILVVESKLTIQNKKIDVKISSNGKFVHPFCPSLLWMHGSLVVNESN